MKFSEMERNYIDDRTGIICGLKELNYIIGTIPLKMFNAYKNNLIDPNGTVYNTSFSSGLGYDFYCSNKAKERAVGEAIERYCSVIYNKKIVKAKYKDLTNALNPIKVTRPIDTNQTITDDNDLFWVKGINNLNGKEAWIPTELVYLAGQKGSIREITSTGLAAGGSLGSATIGGILECIERDAITIMWLNKLSMPIVKHQSIINENILSILEVLKSLGIEITILDITNDLRVASYFVVLERNTTPYISVGAGSSLNFETALMEALREASALYNINVSKHLDNRFSENINGVLTTFEQHSDLYASKDHKAELKFLFQGEEIDFQTQSSNYINCYNDLLKQLDILGLESYTVDITTNDIRKTGLNVVRAILPGLAFLEIRKPMLDCDRLYEVPKKLGYTPTELNPLPHPFP